MLAQRLSARAHRFAPRWLVAPALAVIGLLLLWEGAVRVGEIPQFLLPAPTAIAAYVAEHAQLYLDAAFETAFVTVLGFTAAVVVGVLLAIGMTWWSTFEHAAYPLLVMTQVIPKVAIAPLLIVYMGFGIEPKIFLAFLVAFFPMVINTTLGLRSVSAELLELSAMLRATKGQVLRSIRFPMAIPYIVEGAKLSITLAVIGTIVSEFFAGTAGLGYLIKAAAAQLNTVQGFGALISLAILGILMFEAVVLLGRLVLRSRQP